MDWWVCKNTEGIFYMTPTDTVMMPLSLLFQVKVAEEYRYDWDILN